jgi:hypothetical protein
MLLMYTLGDVATQGIDAWRYDIENHHLNEGEGKEVIKLLCVCYMDSEGLYETLKFKSRKNAQPMQ